MLKPFDIVRVRPEYFENLTRPSRLISFGFVDEERKKRDEAMEKREKNDRDNFGVVTETGGCSASVTWFIKDTSLKTAWWEENDLEVVDNFAAIIANEMAHPFGSNTKQGDKFYGLKNGGENERQG